MERTNTELQAIDDIFSPFEEEEEKDEEERAEEEEEVSEEEDITEKDEDFVATDQEESSDFELESSWEEEPAEPDLDSFTSKDGKVLWSPIPPSDRRRMVGAVKMRKPRGPTRYAVSRADTIKSTFELFISGGIEKIVLNMTNKEGRRVCGDDWKDLDQTDLQGYLGLLILAGVYRSAKEATSSLWNYESGRPIFRATMTLKTFHLITRVIRFDDRKTRAASRAKDKMAAIRQVWDEWVRRLPLMYNPGTDVTVDERLVPFRGRCGFKQYMPRKPAKYGLKIWVACDAQSSYAWNMQMYTGKPLDGQPDKNQGQRVVLDVTEGLRGHIITCDNFFTSYSLGQKLLKRKMTMVGTMRRNKAELPPALLDMKKRARFSSKFAFTDTHALVSYCPKQKRNVLLMSTLHCDTKVSSTEQKKPQIILDYNKNKGGVDTLDKVTSVYSCKRMTARWPLAVFYNMLDVSAYNSFVLWREIDPDFYQKNSNKRRMFLEELGRQLVTPLISRRKALPRTLASASIVMEVQEKAATSKGAVRDKAAAPPLLHRRRCQFCRKDNKTKNRCHKCHTFVCKTHLIITCPSCV